MNVNQLRKLEVALAVTASLVMLLVVLPWMFIDKDSAPIGIAIALIFAVPGGILQIRRLRREQQR